MSRPIPIKSPRELNAGSSSASTRTNRISQSLPVPASPHFGSLKAPPEFLSGMPPLTLPQSYQENELLKKEKDIMAKSAPASDLIAPLHRYRIEDKRNKSATATKQSDVKQLPNKEYSVEVASSELASSVILRMQGLRIDEEEDEDSASPHLASAAAGTGVEEETPSNEGSGKGVLLSNIQRAFSGESSTAEVQDTDDLVSHGNNGDDDEELQFELS